MSANAMIAAYQIIETNKVLTNVEKLVLLRCAWKTREGGAISAGPVNALARELNCCRKAVRNAVRRLVQAGLVLETRRGSDAPCGKNDRGALSPLGQGPDVTGNRGVTPLHTNKDLKRPRQPVPPAEWAEYKSTARPCEAYDGWQRRTQLAEAVQ